jgi:hypothetical protein
MGTGAMPHVNRNQGDRRVVERKIELGRRRRRHEKMQKLKRKLASAKDGRERDNILQKIHKLSPWWKEPAAR